MRILIADDSPFVLAGLRAALEDHGMEVVAACRDAEDACRCAVAGRPDAVLMSAALPGGANEALVRMREALPLAGFLLLVDDAKADVDAMLQLVRIGAHGVLMGATDLERLPYAVLGVLDGEAAFPRRLVRAMADEVAQRHRPRRVPGAPDVELTAREFEVLLGLARGEAAAAVAGRLGISPATIRRHTANAAQKLGVATGAEALAMMRGDAPAGGG